MGRVTPLLFAAALFGLPAAAKRTPPPEVKPLVVESKGGPVRYTPIYERLPGAKPDLFRASLLAESGTAYRVVEKHTVYQIRYKQGLETDVQERFITGLTREVGGILVHAEGGQFYLLDPQRHTSKLLPPAFDEAVGKGPLIVDARGREEKCALHAAPLHDDVVGIVYGLVKFPPDYIKARTEVFPNASSHQYAGCVLHTPRWALVRYCAPCRAQQAIWVKQREPGKV